MTPTDPTVVGDVVIVVPGIMGSALHDAVGRPVWSLSVGSLNNAIATLGGSLLALQLPVDIGDGNAPDGIVATSLLASLHVIPGLWTPITGYSELLTFLRSWRFHLVEPDRREPDLLPNLLTFPYDWRLSNRCNGRLLKTYAERALARWREQPGMEDARLVLVCHSMGGLVARWYVEQEGGAEVTRALVTIGTPHRGSVNALDTLVNGIDPGIGPLHLPLTDFARSLPSMHQLLPTYACFGEPGERRPVRDDDASALAPAMLEDARRFHAKLATVDDRCTLHKIVGTRQPTATTARASAQAGRLLVSSAIDGAEQGGDGTVPRLASEPEAGRGTEVVEVSEQHGALQAAQATLDLLDGILTREVIIWESAPRDGFGVAMADVFRPDESPELVVSDLDDRRLHVRLVDEVGTDLGRVATVDRDGHARLTPLPPGGYRAVVESPVPGGPAPVTRPFLVWDPATELAPAAP